MTTTHVGRLSARQHQVLVMVAEGFTDAQIAAELHVSPSTVHVHVVDIRAAYCAANRTEAVYRAMKAGDLT